MRGKVLITDDTFDISTRIKQIDAGYFVMYNFKTQRFEVHHDGQGLCLVLPFDRLDARAVAEVRRTRAERRRQLLEEMDRHNSKLERSLTARILDKARGSYSDIRKLYIKEKY